MSPLQGAGLCAVGAFLIVAFIASSINATQGVTKVKWFKTAVFVAFAVFLMMTAVFYLPGVL